MNFLNKLEKKYRKYAIPNLMYYIVMLYGAGLVIQLFAPMAYWRFLSLDIGALMHGQIWRLVTFIIYPPTMGTFVFDSVFFGIISLFLYYSLGVTLERVWGAFRFNVFFLMGMVGEILAALVSYFVFHQNLYVTPGFLNFSLRLLHAYAYINDPGNTPGFPHISNSNGILNSRHLPLFCHIPHIYALAVPACGSLSAA